MKRLSMAVLALGAVSIAIGGLLYVLEINHWYLVFLQFGMGNVAVGGITQFERARGDLSRYRLFAVLSLPALVTLVFTSALLASGTSMYDLYPYVPSSGFTVIWFLSSIAVPVTYAMARVLRGGYRWAVATVLVLCVVAPVAFYGATLPLSRLHSELRTFSIILALSFWSSILPYKLGAGATETPDRSREVHKRPVTIVALVVTILLSATALLSLGVPDRTGTLILGAILYGPILYVGLRGISTVSPLPAHR